MSGYFYELPTTEPFSFSGRYGNTVGSYISQVADTTERRANLRTLLKEAKRNSEKDYLKLVKVRLNLIAQGMLTYFVSRSDVRRLSATVDWNSCIL